MRREHNLTPDQIKRVEIGLHRNGITLTGDAATKRHPTSIVGGQFSMFFTGALALDMARRRHYDLVIVSLDMPDMDGWKLVEKLVGMEPVIGRVVLSTGDTSWHMQERAEQAGCFAVLERPFDPGQIIQLLQKV